MGDYRDVGDVYIFDHKQSLTPTIATAQAAIATWAAGGGGDWPEGQLYALHQLAEPPAGTIGWRAGAKRIIVWFGDAPAHDQMCASDTGLAYNITEPPPSTLAVVSVTDRLVAENIAVVAIDVGDLDAAPSGGYPGCPDVGTSGQASRIASATGGSYLSGVTASTISSTIVSLVTTVASSINSVSLVPSGGTAPFVVSINPATYGPLDSALDHTLTFQVTFKGVVECAVEPQEFTGTLDVVADGVVVAQKRVRITVPECEETGCGCCDEAVGAANSAVETECSSKVFTILSSDGAPPACGDVTLPDIKPYFLLRWGDGPSDQMETHDDEWLCLTAVNPYSNITIKGLTVTLTKVTDVGGNPPAALPDGTPSVVVRPSHVICFGDLPACDAASGGKSSVSREVVMVSQSAKEGTYQYHIEYCFGVQLCSEGRTKFDFKLVKS